MTVKELTAVIASLSRTELAELANWFEEYQAEVWDKQIEADVRAGRLDKMIQQAQEEFRAGRCTPL